MKRVGQDEQDQRKDHLDRDLHRLLLGPLTPLEPHLVCLDAEDVGDRDAVGVGLQDGTDEPAQVRHIGTLGEGQVGIPAGLADGDVLQGAHQLLGQGSLAVGRRAPSPTRSRGRPRRRWSSGRACRPAPAGWPAAALPAAEEQQLGQEVGPGGPPPPPRPWSTDAPGLRAEEDQTPASTATTASTSLAPTTRDIGQSAGCPANGDQPLQAGSTVPCGVSSPTSRVAPGRRDDGGPSGRVTGSRPRMEVGPRAERLATSGPGTSCPPHQQKMPSPPGRAGPVDNHLSVSLSERDLDGLAHPEPTDGHHHPRPRRAVRNRRPTREPRRRTRAWVIVRKAPIPGGAGT